MDDMAPGFRFYPTEEELVSFYLSNKLDGKREDLDKLINQIIPVVNIYNFNPWDLPLYLCHKDPEQWFFFIPRQESEARGGRPKRLTASGYWKATGSPGYVYSSDGRPIGVKRTMVFYNGRAPIGKKTEWKMNEYKAIQGDISSTNAAPPLRQEFSLCRVYKKSKCLRSFDRRPAPVVALPPALVPQQGNVTYGVGGGKPHDLENTEITGKATTSSSPASSLSGNHHENRSTQAWGSSSNGSRIVVDDESSFWPDLAALWDSINY